MYWIIQYRQSANYIIFCDKNRHLACETDKNLLPAIEKFKKKSRKVSANCYIDTKIFTLYGKQHQVLVIVESIEKSILLLITQNYLFKESYVVSY